MCSHFHVMDTNSSSFCLVVFDSSRILMHALPWLLISTTTQQQRHYTFTHTHALFHAAHCTSAFPNEREWTALCDLCACCCLLLLLMLFTMIATVAYFLLSSSSLIIRTWYDYGFDKPQGPIPVRLLTLINNFKPTAVVAE